MSLSGFSQFIRSCQEVNGLRLMRVRTVKEEQFVVYVKGENIYLPYCKKGVEVYVIKHETQEDDVCFEDFLIIASMNILKNNSWVKDNSTGFYTRQGFLVKQSRRGNSSVQRRRRNLQW